MGIKIFELIHPLFSADLKQGGINSRNSVDQVSSLGFTPPLDFTPPLLAPIRNKGGVKPKKFPKTPPEAENFGKFALEMH